MIIGKNKSTLVYLEWKDSTVEKACGIMTEKMASRLKRAKVLFKKELDDVDFAFYTGKIRHDIEKNHLDLAVSEKGNSFGKEGSNYYGYVLYKKDF